MGFIRLIESLEHVVYVFIRDAARVAHAYVKAVPLFLGGEPQRTAVSVLYSIVSQCHKYLLSPVRVGVYLVWFPYVYLHIKSFFPCGRNVPVSYILYELIYAYELLFKGNSSGLQPAQLQKVVNEPRKPHGFPQYIAVISGFILVLLYQSVVKGVRKAANRGYGRAQLVRDVGHVLSAGLLQPARLGDIAYQHYGPLTPAAIGQRRYGYAQYPVPDLQLF